MSLPPSVLDRVTISQIFNVQYPTQDAELVSPGGANGPVVGYHSNRETKRMLVYPHILVCLISPLIIAHGMSVESIHPVLRGDDLVEPRNCDIRRIGRG